MEGFKLSYIGGIGRVTGSCTLVKHRETQFLVDCGMVQGEAHADFENKQPFQFRPNEIKFIILTHAHLDHCGLIPRLANEGFNGKIYCSDATRKLTIEILKDSAKISGLYSIKNINNLNFECIDQRDGFKWGKLVPIDNDLMIALYRSAHILGSTSVVIADTNKVDSIWFSGDVGRNCRKEMLQPLLKYRQNPDFRNKLVVCESTYGANTSTDKCKGFEERQDYFKNIFEQTLVKNKGSVVIPAFSLQRTQDILTDLFLLFQNHPSLCNGVSVVCDSPLAKRISTIYAHELLQKNKIDGEDNYKYLNPALITQLPPDRPDCLTDLAEVFRSKSTKIGKHTIQWQKPNYMSKQPTVYISSAGMCSEGPVVKHLNRFLPDNKNTIILTGYQGRGTVGSALVGIMNRESLEDKPLNKNIKLLPSQVHANILMMKDYSGHADKDGLLDYLFNTEREYCPPEIHLNHGDNNAREELRKSIMSRYEELESEKPGVYKRPIIAIPALNSTYTMTDGIVELAEQSSTVEHELDRLEEILRYISSIDNRLASLEIKMSNIPGSKDGALDFASESLTANQSDLTTDTESNSLATQKTIAAQHSNCEIADSARNTSPLACHSEHSSENPNSAESNKPIKFRTTIKHADVFLTDSKKLNDICRDHPAIVRAQMSEQDAIGLSVNYGNYVILVSDKFQYLVPGNSSEWRSGWVETDTVKEMIQLIDSIDGACTPCLDFGNPFDRNSRAKSTRKPKYTDAELGVNRNSDGSIKFQ